MLTKRASLIAAFWMWATLMPTTFAGELNYPETKRVDHIDEYFGVKVADPYRWLEQDVRNSPQVREWVEKQNRVTFGYLEKLPQREQLKNRLTELWDYEKPGTPLRIGSRYCVSHNDGLQNHAVWYVMDELDGPRRVLLNPNDWSEDGTVALGGLSFSPNGRYVAYALQEAGSDWRTWKVRDVASGEDTGAVLRHLKFTSLAWDRDATGFFYGKYPDPESGEKFTAVNERMQLMYHRLGTRQADDVLVYFRPDHPEWSYSPQVSEDGRYLILTVHKNAGQKYRIMYKDLDRRYAMPVTLIPDFENSYHFIGNDDSLFYFRTDLDAPKGRVIAIDAQKGNIEDPREIIPESDNLLKNVSLVNNLLICTYLKDVATQVRLFTLNGRHIQDVDLPGLGTAGGFAGQRTDTETFYSFKSFAVPPSIYRYDLVSMESTLINRARVNFDPDKYVTEQVFYTSGDGTSIPMFIMHRRGLEHNGAHPTLLYGYGGFNISVLPSFSVSRLVWLELGGVYAVANLRGGGEYGRDWHEAGMRLHKQNVFDDFIAAGDYLIANNYTCPEKLSIMGGSNGGLLVGACITQRPELYGAAVAAVGVMDMLRYDQFTAGRFWVGDYGSATESRQMFEYLKGYSPYHNLEQGTAYPATLITTADTDDRVVPLHSFKFAARMQYCQAGEDPVLIRIQTQAGHGSGKPTSMRIQEAADIYAFLAENLGVAAESFK